MHFVTLFNFGKSLTTVMKNEGLRTEP